MTVEKAARAGAWSALDILLRQGVQFVVTVILARLLTPEDFGLIALLAFFTSLSITFVQGGLSMALVQRQDTSHEEESAVFWCNLAASIVFAAILVVIAPVVAPFYGEPLLQPLMFVAAAQVVLSALGAVQTALLTRTLRFDQLTKTGIVSSLASGVAGVAAAMAGLGVWALAIQMLVLAAVGSAMLWWVSNWRPAVRVRLSSVRHLFHFGVFVSLSSVLEVLYQNGFALIIGKFYGVRDLGLFNRAANLQGLPTSIISSIISRIALPLFAARADDPEALRRGFRMSLSLGMILSMPVMAGLALLPDLIILTLFGAQWLPAAPLVTIIAIGGMLMPMHAINIQIVLAQGKSRLFLKLEIQKKVAGVACLAVGSFFGIEGIAYGVLVFSPIALFLNARPNRESINYGALQQIWGLWDVIAATVFMSLGVYLIQRWIEFSPLVELGLLSLSGAILYLGFGFLLRLQSFADAREIVKNLLRRVPAARLSGEA
ncbi:MAG TPA: lipopolysaccharide biosynthesis protein [Allosphingosinicella sp.]|nr:lipopolysaccharide biosynthesis protein [Allosphingosinicella sp.]